MVVVFILPDWWIAALVMIDGNVSYWPLVPAARRSRDEIFEIGIFRILSSSKLLFCFLSGSASRY